MQNTDVAIAELHNVANSITERDLETLYSNGGINTIHNFIQLYINARVNLLQQKEQS